MGSTGHDLWGRRGGAGLLRHRHVGQGRGTSRSPRGLAEEHAGAQDLVGALFWRLDEERELLPIVRRLDARAFLDRHHAPVWPQALSLQRQPPGPARAPARAARASRCSQYSRPSAATLSAHHQPRTAVKTKPTSSAAAMYAQVIEHAASPRRAALSMRVAIARLRRASRGMPTTATSASAIPTGALSGRLCVQRLTPALATM